MKENLTNVNSEENQPRVGNPTMFGFSTFIRTGTTRQYLIMKRKPNINEDDKKLEQNKTLQTAIVN